MNNPVYACIGVCVCVCVCVRVYMCFGAFVGLDNKLYKMHGTYLYITIMLSLFTGFLNVYK